MKEKITTKECPICKNTNLLLFATLNLKVCTDCSLDIDWIKLDHQPPFYCAKPTRIVNEKEK